MGYHKAEITRGVYGEFSKITEEYEELLDAHAQDVHAMVTVSLQGKVFAKTREEVLEKASQMSLSELCFQCSEGDVIDESWGLNGELDGEPFEITVVSRPK